MKKDIEFWDKEKITTDEQNKILEMINEKLRVKNLSKDKTDEENIPKIDKELKDSPYYKENEEESGARSKEKSLFDTNEILEIDLKPKISKLGEQIQDKETKLENKIIELDLYIKEYNDTEAIIKCVDMSPDEAEKELTPEQYEKWISGISVLSENKLANEALKKKIEEMRAEVNHMDNELQKLRDQLKN
jgi:hypothetical protein